MFVRRFSAFVLMLFGLFVLAYGGISYVRDAGTSSRAMALSGSTPNTTARMLWFGGGCLLGGVLLLAVRSRE